MFRLASTKCKQFDSCNFASQSWYKEHQNSWVCLCSTKILDRHLGPETKGWLPYFSHFCLEEVSLLLPMKDPQMASGRFQLGATLNQVVAVWKTGLGSAGSPGPGFSHWVICFSAGFFKHKKRKQNAHFSAVVRDTLFVLWDGLILASWWLCGSWWELASL